MRVCLNVPPRACAEGTFSAAACPNVPARASQIDSAERTQTFPRFPNPFSRANHRPQETCAMNTVQLAPDADFAKAVEQLGGNSELLLPRGVTFDVARTPVLHADAVRIGAFGDASKPPPVVRA